MNFGMAVHNAPTDHGGIIPSTLMNKRTIMGKQVVRAGDGHFCPKCKVWSEVKASHDHVIFDGKSVAYENDELTCDARILKQQSHTVGNSRGIGFRNGFDLSSIPASITNFIDKEVSSKSVKLTPKIMIPNMGVLAKIERMDGKKISANDFIKVNGRTLSEVWIASNGIAYFIPSEIYSTNYVDINGEKFTFDEDCKRTDNNKEIVDSLFEQFNVLNEAIVEHKKDIGNKNISLIMIQALSRYETILKYIEEANWDLESQQYLV